MVLFLHFKFILCKTVTRNAHFLGVQKKKSLVFSMYSWEIYMSLFPHVSFLQQVYICTKRDIFQYKWCQNPFHVFVKKGKFWNLYSRQLASISSLLTLLLSICLAVGTSSGCLTLFYPFKTEHVIWNEERRWIDIIQYNFIT